VKTQGKTVLITGGGSGIGLALAKEFVARGSKVIIIGRTLAKLEAAKAETPSLEIAQCDVTDTEAVATLAERCANEFGGIDVLVNNAGVFSVFSITDREFSLDDQLAEVDIDLGGPIRMVHHFLPGLMERSEAVIINVSSVISYVPFAMAPVYSATKAGTHAWSRALRKQLSKTNVRVMEVLPAMVDTEMVAAVDAPKMSTEDLVEHVMKGFDKDKDEIVPGQAKMLKLMSRFTPGLIFKLTNK
jgi:uncharacterized oxidoreductase